MVAIQVFRKDNHLASLFVSLCHWAADHLLQAGEGGAGEGQGGGQEGGSRHQEGDRDIQVRAEGKDGSKHRKKSKIIFNLFISNCVLHFFFRLEPKTVFQLLVGGSSKVKPCAWTDCCCMRSQLSALVSWLGQCASPKCCLLCCLFWSAD